MKNFLVFSFFIALVSSSNLDPLLQGCTDEDSLDALTACSPFVTSLTAETNKYSASKPEPEVMSNISVLCDQTTECLGKLKCKSLKPKRVFFQEACDGLQFMDSDLLNCVPQFHKVVFNKKYECSKNFDFESIDMSKRRESYTNGKSCVLEIVKKECSAKALKYFETKYDHYVDIRTNRPEECEGNHHNLEAMKCMHLGEEFNEQKGVLAQGLKVNDTKILRVLEICDAVLNCDACMLKSRMGDLKETCGHLKLINSEMGVCVRKMDAMDMDKEKYPCYKDDAKCDKSEKTIKCFTDAIVEYCGQSAADDFSRKLDDVMAMINC